MAKLKIEVSFTPFQIFIFIYFYDRQLFLGGKIWGNIAKFNFPFRFQ